jgi:HlyD family type I secretion membrane fusion protein
MAWWKFWVGKPQEAVAAAAADGLVDGWERDPHDSHPALAPDFAGSRSARPLRRGFFREAYDGLFIEDVRLRSVIRSGILVVVVFFAIFGAWSTLVKLDAAVVAPGLVKVDGNRWTVQHSEGGLVEKVLVSEGQTVQRGDVLMELRDVRISASANALQARIDAERVRLARLEAERDGRHKLELPADLAVRLKTDGGLRNVLMQEEAVMQSRFQALDPQIRSTIELRRRTEDEMGQLRQRLQTKIRLLALAREEYDQNVSLADQGFVSRARLVGFERQVAEYESQRQEMEVEIGRINQRLIEFDSRIAQLRSSFLSQVDLDLRECSLRIADIQQQLRPSEDASDRLVIRSPADGRLMGLRITKAGSVIAPREPIVDVVPDGGGLILEVRVPPEEIGFIKQGALARIRFTGMDAKTMPLFDGKVRVVSADRMVEGRIDPKLNPGYYLAIVEIDAEALAKEKFSYQPGLSAEVFIRSSTRTLLSYLFDPMMQYGRQAFRER